MSTTLVDHRAGSEASTDPAACAVKPANLARPKPIAVNGVSIPRDAIARETQNHPAAKPIEAWLAAARALVVRELLMQEALRLAIEPQPIADGEGRRETDDEARVRQLIEQQVTIPSADEAACRRIYQMQAAKFRSVDLYAVRHILLAAAPGDTAARQSARTDAEAVIAELIARPETFAELASAFSACPSRAAGGQLGQISRGQTVPEFETALAFAPVGAVNPDPIETRYGFHVVCVDQRIAGQQVPFEVVRHQIAEWLEARAHHTAIRDYITMLAGNAQITGIVLDQSAASPAP